MITEDYKRYIKSPQWKMKCQRAYATYGKKCMACGSFRNLHIHHATYDRFKRELMMDLRVVCHDCHRRIHALHKQNRNLGLKLITDRYINSMKNKKL